MSDSRKHHHTASYSPLGAAAAATDHHHHVHRSLPWPRRKLFLLVLAWTCICLVAFKTSLLSPSAPSGPPQEPQGASSQQADHNHYHHPKLAARSAASSLEPVPLWPASSSSSSSSSSPAALEILAPELADLPGQGQGDNQHKSHHQYQPQYQYQSSQTNVISSSILSSSSSRVLQQTSTSSEGDTRTGVVASSTPPVKTNSDLSSKPSKSKQSTTTTSGVGQQRRQKSAADDKKKKKKEKHENNARHHQIVGGDQCHYHYPNLFDLQFNNIHWQKFVSQANGEKYASFTRNSSSSHPMGKTTATYYLYNAYYDDRWRGGLPSVRVLAMIDRIHPPPTNCLLWSSQVQQQQQQQQQAKNNNNNNNRFQRPLVTRAEFVYAWYPKWGNYEDGLLQPWIVTCRMPRDHVGRVPDSVSLVDVPAEVIIEDSYTDIYTPPMQARRRRRRRDLQSQASSEANLMPPSFSSSSSSSSLSSSSSPSSASASAAGPPSPAASSSASPAFGPNHLLQATSPLVSSTTSRHHPTGGGGRARKTTYDCSALGPISNNLPVFNRRPPGGKREKFAVCVKGLDFPFDGPESRVSIRLVEWIEMLNLLGAKKIFLYELDVHENISKVLNYYQQRGLVELSPLTLPGDQPNLPEYQHLYLKQKLTSKRQNELIPYNDCLYRNLYSYEYLALLDIDELIMPLKRGHTSWYDLMGEVERVSLSEQNYSRASYNVRNVYFFDDLSGPLGTTQANTQPAVVFSSSSSSSSSTSSAVDDNDNAADEDDDDVALNELLGNEDDQQQVTKTQGNRSHRDSAERGIPHYLHMMSHVYRSKNYTEPGQYVKCFHNTERVVSLHNHFPMNCFGQCTTYSIPLDLAHLQHYRKDCVGPLRQSCKNDFRLFTTRDTTIWRYKQRMIRRTTRVLNHLQLLGGPATATAAA